MKQTVFILLLSLSAFFACSQDVKQIGERNTSFKKAPYMLYTGVNTEMLVLWQTTTMRTCAFSWGTDTTYSTGSITTGEYGNDHQHQFTVSGLSPNKKYFYKVTIVNDNVKKGSFVAGASDGEKKISFYTYGDTRTYPAIHNQVAEQILQDVSQHPETQTFIISTGDFVANGDKEEDWENQFFHPQYESLQQMLAELPYMAAVGNHEGQGLLFKKYFPYPQFVSSRYYFSFDYGPAHFTVLDQFTSYAEGSPQYNWLVNDLEASNKAWKFILLHKPGWTAGGVHTNNTDVQNIIQPLCQTYGVQFVLSGHNHYYSRAEVSGVMHITTGGGGAPLYTPNPFEEKIIKVNKSNHYCKIEIDNDSLMFSAITKEGVLIETFNCSLSPEDINDRPDKGKFKVFSSGRLIKVLNDENVKGHLSVYDNYGRLVFQNELVDRENNIRMDTGGIYFVRIDFNGKRMVQKIFVK